MIDFDIYETIEDKEVREKIKIQRSEFIGIVFPITGEDAFSSGLTSIQKEFHGATHHCWAWRHLGADEIREVSSDAGEPSGSAGRPILQAIQSAELLDVGVVVVRYYGGVKLGTGGLGRAYRDAAREAIAKARHQIRYLYRKLLVRVPYSGLSNAYRLVSPPDIVLVDEVFGETNEFLFDVRRSRVDSLARELTEKRIEHEVRGVE